MHKLKKLLERELECFDDKKELSRSDIEPIYHMVCAYKDLIEICEMEEEWADTMQGFPIEGNFGLSFQKGYAPIRRASDPKRGMPIDGMRRNPVGGYDRRTQGALDSWQDYYSMDEEDSKMRDSMMKNPYYTPKAYMAGEHEKAEFTHADAKKWLAAMENADGTTGAHFPLEKTSAVAKQLGIVFGDKFTDWEFNVVMNMMYSDYCKTAQKFGVDKPEYYAMLAKDFLMDDDSVEPKEKISAYFDGIVKPAM